MMIIRILFFTFSEVASIKVESSESTPTAPTWRKSDWPKYPEFAKCREKQFQNLKPVKPITAEDRELLAKTPVYLMIFFGRKNFQLTQWRYLRPNLRKYGGIIDKIFYLGKFKGKQPYLNTGFDKEEPNHTQLISFASRDHWCKYYKDHANVGDGPGIYIKIDDDLTYIHEDAFEYLALSVLKNKNVTIHSGNVINHSHLPWVHAQLGAIGDKCHDVSVDKSYLTKWVSHKVKKRYMMGVPTKYCLKKDDFDYGGYAWESWYYGAYQNAAFIDALQKNDTAKYTFDTWDWNACSCPHSKTEGTEKSMYCNAEGQYRWTVNAVAYRWKNIEPHLHECVSWYDERWFSQYLPRLSGVSNHAVGGALFAHMGFKLQYVSLTNANMSIAHDQILTKYQELYDADGFGKHPTYPDKPAAA